MPLLILAKFSIAFVTPFVCMVGLFALFAVLSIRYENKRTESLKSVADELGMEFSIEEDSQLLSKLATFRTFTLGRNRSMKNVMKAETEDASLAIFEYSYRTGSGKNSTTVRFTVAAMEQSSFNFPAFSARPEGLMDRMGSALGFQDIDFDHHPEFSKAFVLKGENEVAIRNFFDTTILDVFVSKKDAYVEAGRGLITLRKHGRQKPEQIAEFMAEAYEFLNAFKAAKEEGVLV